MLVGHADAETEVALGVGAFEFECYALLLVACQEDIGVKTFGAVDESGGHHVDVDALDDAELGKRFVGAVDGLGAVGHVTVEEAFLFEGRGEEVVVAVGIDHGDAFVVDGVALGSGDVFASETARRAGHEDDAVDDVAAVRGYGVGFGGRACLVAERARGTHHHGEVDVERLLGGVGGEGDVFFGEAVVAGIAHQGCQSGAFGVERRAVEVFAAVEGEIGRVGHDDAFDGGVGEFIGHVADHVRLAGIETIVHADARAVVADGGVGFDLRVHEAFVDEGLAQLAGGGFRELAVVDHRRLPEAAQPAVVPPRGVAPRHVVDAELQLGEAEHFMVGLLAHIVDELCAVEAGGIVDQDADVVEQHLSFRHMTGRAAGRQGRQQQGYRYYGGDVSRHGLI